MSTTVEFMSTTMEFLSTMTELQDTMMKSQCNTIYNGTAFNGFLECGSRFTLRLNTAKSTNYTENCFRQKQSKIKFSTKKIVDAHLYVPKQWSQGAPKTCIHILVTYISKIANIYAPLLHSWESQRYGFTEFLVGNSIILISFCLNHFLI